MPCHSSRPCNQLCLDLLATCWHGNRTSKSRLNWRHCLDEWRKRKWKALFFSADENACCARGALLLRSSEWGLVVGSMHACKCAQQIVMTKFLKMHTAHYWRLVTRLEKFYSSLMKNISYSIVERRKRSNRKKNLCFMRLCRSIFTSIASMMEYKEYHLLWQLCDNLWWWYI
jgi:hypothetical protein